MEKVRFGVIGCGGITHWHIETLFQRPEAEIVALCDPDPGMIERCRAKFPALASVPSYPGTAPVYEIHKPDGVLICSPHKYHAEQIVEAFANGVHVFCEKPLVHDLDEIKLVTEARDKSGKIGMLGYQRHLQGEFVMVREIMESGRYGAFQQMHTLLCQNWKRATANSWRQVPELSCGGMLNDSGSHLVDVLLWTTGRKAKTVQARTDNRGTPVDINSSVQVEFEGGGIGSISIFGDAPLWYEETTWAFDEATLLLRDGQLTVHENGGRRWKTENLPGKGSPSQHFLDVILGKSELACGFEHGRAVVELTAGAYWSAANGGQPVAL